jgi:hypothetical protein
MTRLDPNCPKSPRRPRSPRPCGGQTDIRTTFLSVYHAIVASGTVLIEVVVPPERLIVIGADGAGMSASSASGVPMTHWLLTQWER